MSQQSHVHGVAGLKKHDIKVSGIVFMLYCLVGAGAFGIEEMIPESGPGMTLILLTVFPVVWAYPISNLTAECGSLMPSEGGVYVWVKEAFGEFWGFQAGWWGTVSTYITNGVYVTLVTGYVSQLIPMSEISLHVLRIGMVLIFTVINLFGIKEVGKVSTVLSVLIVLAFALVSIVGFMNWNTSPVEPMMPEGYNLLDSIGNGICICVWMYCGYECISNMAGEVKNPQVIPKGLMIAMPIVALTYILPTIAGLATLPSGSWMDWATDGGFGNETVGYATVLTQNLGNIWGYIFLLVAIVSQCAIFNTYMASGSRGFFVLADDNLCPRFMVRISRKRGVPYVGIISLAIVTLLLSQSDFTTLVSIEVVFILDLYIILSIAVIKLRKTVPVDERKKRGLYVMPGGKLGLIFFTSCPILISAVALLVNGTDYLMTGLIGTVTGPLVYIVFKRKYGGLSVDEPGRYPVNTSTKLAFGDIFRIGIFISLLGSVTFIGQFWLRWYEIDYGGWTSSDYDMMGEFIPQILVIFKWAGLCFIAAGICIMAYGYKKDRPSSEETVDYDYFIEKYSVNK